MIHSRGSSIQGVPAATHSHVHASGANEIEPPKTKTEEQRTHASSSGLSNEQAQHQGVTVAPAQGEQQGWHHAESTSDPVQKRPQPEVPAAPQASSAFPLKLAEITEADILEKRSQASAQLQQPAGVAKLLGRLADSVSHNPAQV